MVRKMETAQQQFVHRENIARYGRILATYLTAEERRFVERRLAEEQAALQHLRGSAVQVNDPVHAA
jgi:hypothetical protein